MSSTCQDAKYWVGHRVVDEIDMYSCSYETFTMWVGAYLTKALDNGEEQF